jgi:hypothetical protein
MLFGRRGMPAGDDARHRGILVERQGHEARIGGLWPYAVTSGNPEEAPRLFESGFSCGRRVLVTGSPRTTRDQIAADAARDQMAADLGRRTAQ